MFIRQKLEFFKRYNTFMFDCTESNQTWYTVGSERRASKVAGIFPAFSLIFLILRITFPWLQ